MSKRHLTSIGLLLMLPAMAAVAASEEIRVVAFVREERVVVSFAMMQGLNEELQAALKSGLPTAITYEVELRRAVTWWFDRLLQTAMVNATAQFDNLTRRYRLTRTIDGRGEEPILTEDEAAVRQWLTSSERLPLFGIDRLEPNVEYYVRVRARTRPAVAWFFWPWDRGTASGTAKFTFVQ